MRQADAFAGDAPLFEHGSIREAACMAHARRKTCELHTVCSNAIT
nr:transposase [Pandoraea oxalativorans]